MDYFITLCDSLRDMRNLKVLKLAGMSVCVHVSTMIIMYVRSIVMYACIHLYTHTCIVMQVLYICNSGPIYVQLIIICKQYHLPRLIF